MLNQNDATWQGAYKIPWDNSDFSRRMLREHLAQDHDLASRRVEWIERQVAWIHETLLDEQASDLLDLGCGPGFYSHRLTALGHRCRGIDFGPASIEYARKHVRDGQSCEFVLGDIRTAAFGGPYDLVMMLYGELNVFSPDETGGILAKAHTNLRPRGRLIVEVQTPEAVERTGRAEPSRQEADSGLFSDQPHCRQTENRWLPEERIAVQTFHVTDTASGQITQYRNTTQAWPDAELAKLLVDAGFPEASPCDTWPCNTEDLRLWIARRD
ncbi:MAG: class I SAM-dependent methyltransferase [Pirellulales bacterium]|nr:class I SAM-dependent methyltransferase [Pirellulales bacterium]